MRPMAPEWRRAALMSERRRDGSVFADAGVLVGRQMGCVDILAGRRGEKAEGRSFLVERAWMSCARYLLLWFKAYIGWVQEGASWESSDDVVHG